MIAVVLAVLAGAGADAEPPRPPAADALDVEACVRVAVAGSGLVQEAHGRAQEWEARLEEIEAVHYPKLTALGFVAPMYRVERTPGPIRFGAGSVHNDYESWGPYFHVQALLVQPLWTFGRSAAGERAAGERLEVEQARVDQVKNAVALEVRRFYFLHLYARSLLPALDSARKTLDEAQSKAKTEFDAGSGKVTTVDLAKLAYGSAELDKFRLQARSGADAALSALKHTMGMAEEATLTLADERLPDPPTTPLPPLADLILLASRERPEAAQLRHGKEAAVSLEQAERLARMPTLFAAGQIDANTTALRDNAKNPYLYDPYNGVTGGVAVGLQLDLDVAKSEAKAHQARALQEQVEGLATFAKTGIPLEVRRARDLVEQAEKLHALSEEGATAGRKWLLFAANAWQAGTGEPKEILDGLAAYLNAKRGVYDNLLAIHVGRAELLRAVGSAKARPDLAP